MPADPLDKQRLPLAPGPALVLLASAACLALAPRLMPESYSWIAQTTSESAAQGIEGAWLARLGFLLFGVGVAWLTKLREARWGAWGARLHLAFALLMTATAAFSDKPWISDMPFDVVEDALHTFTSTALGFAFAFGVLLAMLGQLRSGSRRIAMHVIAIAAATLLPLAMAARADFAGVLQRLLFLCAYAWYLSEARTDVLSGPQRP